MGELLAAPGLELRRGSASLMFVVLKRLSLNGTGKESISVPWLGMDRATGALTHQEVRRKERRTHRLSSGDRLSLKKEQFWLSISASLEGREEG